MKIEIWSDFVCPFCYIGEKKLEEALSQMPFIKNIEILFKSFELDPQAPLYNGSSIDEAIAKKYGLSVEQARQNNEGIKQHAADVGLTFDFDIMKPTNTLDAHRLTKLASSKGLEKNMVNLLFKAYFENGALISDHEILAKLGTEAGLDEDDVKSVLNDPNCFLSDVRQDENQAQQYGVSAAPYFVIDNTYAIRGAQPVELFIRALTDAWSKKQESNNSNNGMICDENGCELPK
ncbi:DsbA family oxidoreductase [Vagococcus vulneris]|uniref:Disulfide bond formation protein DsbA n=1 Tax=Vagococcus vulneris TaxID=1977869 RepID=A0A429ZZB3_9ENTE|nr:DsbA family oxidoreductase [Vagococcus vulneris]RST99357.1 disulfide bond formation protein DsbA [Vagococcus vulneris]